MRDRKGEEEGEMSEEEPLHHEGVSVLRRECDSLLGEERQEVEEGGVAVVRERKEEDEEVDEEEEE